MYMGICVFLERSICFEIGRAGLDLDHRLYFPTSLGNGLCLWVGIICFFSSPPFLPTFLEALHFIINNSGTICYFCPEGWGALKLR